MYKYNKSHVTTPLDATIVRRISLVRTRLSSQLDVERRGQPHCRIGTHTKTMSIRSSLVLVRVVLSILILLFLFVMIKKEEEKGI
jgi:hypothetical protein